MSVPAGDLGFGPIAGATIAANSTSGQVPISVVTASGGPIPVFPTLPAGFPLKWRPAFRTTVGAAGSGREVRWINQNYALHEFEIPFYVLRDSTQNQTAYVALAGFTDFMALCQLWLAVYGRGSLFYFSTPWDSSRQNQFIGTGDGSTTIFIIQRQFGFESGSALSEPVGGVQTVTDVESNGVVVPTANYYVQGDYLVFNTAPASGASITMTFSFYYLCRFTDDKQDFEEFFKNIWMVPSLKFRSTIGAQGGLGGGGFVPKFGPLIYDAVP